MKTPNLSLHKTSSYSRAALLLIISFSVIRGIIAFTMELGGDEAYYWFYSLHLKLNYFDHPPMVAFFVRFFTANLLLQNFEGFIRLGNIVGCALSSWFVFKTCSLLHSERAGFFSVCLYNVSFYAAITAGLLTMPDSPQMVFYSFCLWMIARITADDSKWLSWILFGVAAGLCIMSKVHGVFIWIGLGLFILFKKRNWLTKPQLYLALFLSLIITSPILIWNLQYDFATYRFDSERVTIRDNTIHFRSFITEVISQIFFNNPFNFALTITALIAYLKQRIAGKDALTVYNFIALPLMALLLIVSLFRSTTLPHWSGPAYVALIPLAAIRLADTNRSNFPSLLSAGIVGFIVFLIAWQIIHYCYPGTWGSKNTQDLGKGDVTLDKFGRRKAGKEFAAFYQNEIKKGEATARTPVIYYKWWAADIEYYFCRPFNIQMIGLGNLNNLHEYMWMNELRKNKVDMSSAFCIVPSEDMDDIKEHYSPYYKQTELAAVITCSRGGKPVRHFFIYRMKGWKNNWPTINTREN